MKVTANFSHITGKIKPMHGVGQPPFIGLNFSLFHYLTEANIPVVRLHDVGGAYGGFRFVDIPNIFRDFSADETLPESYDFAFTDKLMEALEKTGCEPFFRLGVTIENQAEIKAYRTTPPADTEKWARISEHIIRHYNEGWANGYHLGIRYFEIWNEPEGWLFGDGPSPTGMMWSGSKADYFHLYDVTSKHLRACFGDSIRIGGYASCGVYECENDPELEGFKNPKNEFEWRVHFLHDFLRFVGENHCPFDYFSWHVYADLDVALRHVHYIRAVLEKYGFGDVPDILNEWNPTHDILLRSTPMAAARVLSYLLAFQKEPTEMLCFYDARLSPSEYGGLFNPDTWRPYLAYYALKAFGDLYRLSDEVETSSEDARIYVGGASDGTRSALLLANPTDAPVEVTLDLAGVKREDAEVLRIDAIYTYTLTGIALSDAPFVLPPYSCTEIRF